MPKFDIFSVPDGPQSPAHGFYVIAVPRSLGAPHAVLINDGLRFPRRNGSTTRYLTEAEIAIAYQERMQGQSARATRLKELEGNGRDRLSGVTAPWLIISLVPELAGSMPISQASVMDIANTFRGRPAQIVNGYPWERALARRGRIVVDATYQNRVEGAENASLELYGNGCGFFATRLEVLNGDVEARFEASLVSEEETALSIIAGVLTLAEHARDRTGAFGDVLLSAVLTVPRDGHAPAVQLGNSRGSSDPRRSGPLTISADARAETVAALDDVAVASKQLLLASRALVSEIGQSFGFPESIQLTDQGDFAERYWNPTWTSIIKPWASKHGLSFT